MFLRFMGKNLPFKSKETYLSHESCGSSNEDTSSIIEVCDLGLVIDVVVLHDLSTMIRSNAGSTERHPPRVT